jgi:hypothetical protein
MWRGIAVGAVAGLTGTIAMTQFQNLYNALSDGQTQKKNKKKEPATVKVAQKISELVTGERIDKSKKSMAGQIVHYGFGTVTGAVYGAIAERQPRVGIARGLGFGTAVWLGADEITVPALGFSEPPTKAPLSSHLYGLIAHLVYGLSTEAARAGVFSLVARRRQLYQGARRAA